MADVTPQQPMSDAGEAYLSLARVEAWLGPRRVFNDLSLELRRGEHTVVLGPNGAGKSALVRLISRQLYPVVRPGSELRLFGSSCVNLWELRRRIGFVSSSIQTSYRPGVCGADVVLSGFFGSVGLGRSQPVQAPQRQRVRELMEQLALTDLADQPYGQLSDGQQRRLLLARALVHGPEVLVLDEPTNGLDLRARHQLLALLRQLCRSGTTLLLVTHQLDAVIPEIQRVVLLQEGTVVGDGATAAVLQDAPLSALYGTPLRVVQRDGWHQALPGAELG